MKEHELTNKLREQYVKEVVGERKPRTLEDALQEALDNTTPEFPGYPGTKPEKPEEEENAEWI
jgi:hypothetical protein